MNTIHDDLLDQAVYLYEEHDKTRPKQASLNRAVSTAYYAIFHKIIHACSLQMFGATKQSEQLRYAAARKFEHKHMKDVCKRITDADKAYQLLFGIIPKELRDVCLIFVQLQEERHRADYDLSAQYSRKAVQATCHIAKSVFQNMDYLKSNHDDALTKFSMLLFIRARG